MGHPVDVYVLSGPVLALTALKSDQLVSFEAQFIIRIP